MEKITIEINTLNSAFEDQSELPRILNEVARLLEEGYKPSVIRDICGNKVGEVKYE